MLAEAQFLWNGKKGDPGLDGKFKLGGWRHFGTFTGERFTLSGVSLANPASGGVPANLSGDFGVYSVFEQKIYRVGQDDDRGVGVFGGHPIARRTAISSMSIQMRASSSWVSAKVDRKINSVSPEAMRASRCGPRRSMPIFQHLNGAVWPARTYEGLVTAVYQYEVRGGFTLQPNFQYITHPGGGATNPLGTNQPGKVLKNAAVLGLRTVLKF